MCSIGTCTTIAHFQHVVAVCSCVCRVCLPQANVAMRSITLRTGDVWQYHDHGPRDFDPLILLPGTSGTASCFFNQITSLSARGYRVVAVRLLVQIRTGWRGELTEGGIIPTPSMHGRGVCYAILLSIASVRAPSAHPCLARSPSCMTSSISTQLHHT